MPMTQPKSPQESRQSAIRATAKYGGMAFELLGACLAGVFIGKKLDAWLAYDRPVWAVFLTILFMVAALYLIYKQLLSDN